MSQLKPQEVVRLGDIQMANHLPFVLFGGMNVLESKDLAFEIAETYVDICKRLDIPYVFKASFDKANRSSLHSFRGPGLEKGIEWLGDIKKHFNVPIITDVHEPYQVCTSCRSSRYYSITRFLKSSD